MLNSTSVKTRFLLSIASNFMRSALSFASGLLVARALNPSGYGDLMFLLGSFAAIKTLLDMGSSSAFYTFISQKDRDRSYYLFYFGWMAIQFAAISAIVLFLLPGNLISMIWLDHSRALIFLAFAAYFMQQQLWSTVIQIGEASRKTVRVQTVNFLTAALHFSLIGALFLYDGLSVNVVFILLIAEFAAASLVAWLLLRSGFRGQESKGSLPLSFREMFSKYVEYCKPLMFLSWVGFIYNFADNWMLQRFGGASQQGFYQASFQFSAISLIATSSILNVFWKEIAEANDRGNLERVAFLYRRVNRGLVIFSSIVSGLLIPWSWQISMVFLGGSYALAAPVMMIMFFFPIHASMGQVSGTMFLASGRTYTYFLIGAFFMLISIPISYFIQAPVEGLLIPGLGLGAIGMALKMVLINVVSVNAQAWFVSRYCKISYEWAYQVLGIGGIVAIGYLSRTFAGLFWNLSELTNKGSFIVPAAISVIVYLPLVFIFIWLMPWLAGVDRDEIRSAIAKLNSLRFRS